MCQNRNSQDLTLEQQFSIRSFAAQVKRMTEDQAKELLVKLYEEITLRDIVYKQLLKHKWCGDNLEEIG